MKNFKSNYRGTRPVKSKQTAQEFGKAKKGVLICKSCNIFYYQKSWHHDADSFAAKRENKDFPLNFTICPACKMIADHQYEGMVKIKNVPADYKKDLLNLIRGYGERAFSRDPLHRVINAEEKGNEIIVTTTENELANKLTDKIKDSFKGAKTKISFNREPSDVAQATVEFLD